MLFFFENGQLHCTGGTPFSLAGFLAQAACTKTEVKSFLKAITLVITLRGSPHLGVRRSSLPKNMKKKMKEKELYHLSNEFKIGDVSVTFQQQK